MYDDAGGDGAAGEDDARRGLGLAPDSASYFDVFVYLADQQLVEVELLVEGPSAGLLDKDRGEQHLRKGAKMSVPLAAASALQEKQLALLKKPEHITKIAARSAYTQDACCLLDLCSVCPVFFEFATRIAYLCDDDELFLAVQRILRERLKKLAAILENDYLRTTAVPKTFGANATATAFREALKQGQASGEWAETNLEGTNDASRKTFIRGLTLGERRAVEVRRQQLLQM